METASVATKRKGRGGKANPKTRASQRRKNLQKPVYVFVQAIKTENAYQDYFNPDPDVEKRLLGLSDLVGYLVSPCEPLLTGSAFFRNLKKRVAGGSMTPTVTRSKRSGLSLILVLG